MMMGIGVNQSAKDTRRIELFFQDEGILRRVRSGEAIWRFPLWLTAHSLRGKDMRRCTCTCRCT